MPKDAQQQHILLIEDDKWMRRLLGMYLKKKGYTLSMAENGFEGLLQLDADTTDLIILDLMMPVMDGIKFLQEVRQVKRLTVPIMVLTATAPSSDHHDLLELGATLIAHKPIKPPELLKYLEQLLP